MGTEAVVLDDIVYNAVRALPEEPDWLRLVLLVKRSRGEHAFVLSMMDQRIDLVGGKLASRELSPPARKLHPIFEWFEEHIDVEGWLRVLVVCDRDGANSATVTVAPEGPPEVDYVGGSDDPFWNYVDDHRAELEELARRHYGSPRRGLFRR